MDLDYLLTFHEADIVRILQDENISNHFKIHVNFIVLYEHQPKLAVELLKEPEECLEAWDQAILKAQMRLLKEGDIKFKVKNNVHCRIYHLPGLPEVCRIFFPDNEDVGKFVQVSGTVMSISPIKILQYQRSYICIKCKYPTLATAEYEKRYCIKQPKKCRNPNICPGTNFIQGEFSDYCKDFQQIKIQEQIKKLGVGSMPNTMWVTLEDDLVDSCKPGDNVTICGIVKRRWGEFCKGNKIDIDIVLKANTVQVDSNSNSVAASITELQETFCTFWKKYFENPIAGRDLILKSFCPQIYGLYLVKLAIATVLAGGCQVEDTTFTGVCTRSESHLLLVGDPGTGKSELLRFVSKIIPRSVLTNGVGSTAAGLTVAAVMEHGEWQLEGGALVMSDGGVCCIDEFNSMKEHDRTSIHEAMEQQTISVAKASIVCKLNTRCSILATCNPKGNLDSSNPLCMNIALPSPLLSRFDLILLLRDAVNEQWDSHIADYILNGKNSFSKLTDNALWNTDILQSYFIAIRKINPKLSEDGETILNRYYQMQRKIGSRNKARTTIRLLESLIRLSQGHARLMFHNEVEVIDSIYAVVLVDIAMDVSSILNLNISTRSTFPDSPMRDYHSLLENVLNKLNLRDIFQKEIAIMRKNRVFESENRTSRFFIAKPDDHPLEQNENCLTSNLKNKRKITESPHGKVKSVKRTDENCEAVSSKLTVKEYNVEDEDCNLDIPKKDVMPDHLSLPSLAKESEITESSPRSDECKEQSHRSSRPQRANTEVGNCGIENISHTEGKADEKSKEDNAPKKSEIKHRNGFNDFLKDDLKMLMLIPNVNDDLDIDLNID